MNIVYGPVSSWRLGKSLGVDILCRENKKTCTLDCLYCSLGETKEKTIKRKKFVPTSRIKEELRKAIDMVEADVVTMSGTGEPTLAQNLGESIEIAREITNRPIAVLTNSTLMSSKDVLKELAKADIVVGSLDAPNQELFEKINKPSKEIIFRDMVQGMKKFSKDFEGKFSLEIMFLPQNFEFSEEIAKIAESINPDEVQINTPLRENPVSPLLQTELGEVEKKFEEKGMRFINVYEVKKAKVREIVGAEKLKKLKRAGGN